MRLRLLAVTGVVLGAGILLTACDTGQSKPQDVAAMMRTAVTPTPGPATSTPAPTVPPTETLTPVPPPTISMDTTEVKAQLAQVEADTAKMRGLKPKAHVPEHFYSQEELKYHLAQQTL